MTVKKLKEILEGCNDDDRIIIDAGDTMKATDDNEVLFAFKHRAGNMTEYAPVVVLQTKQDVDLENQIESALEHYQEENWDEADALSDMLEQGYTLDNFKYDPVRYEWASNIAREHGLI